ncbi:unnamed protein product [Microthlaspi erraticum]|uniref:F-box domain-containing protein n=1 Tax=Microthlaspi erraticum TaxID=1685480 RepID=A0A6D2IER0_9BRAS|nr:unnamed protein product [Microthlaspi erraticum]
MVLELPEELLEEILCRVPTTSLIRLRSTCKQWNSLVNDRRFTRTHFDKAPKQFTMCMLNNHLFCSMSINLRSFPHVEVTRKFGLNKLHSSLDQIKFCHVFHCCEGLLLCVTRENHPRLVVWNPCTRQTRWINSYKGYTNTYALGSYQDQKSPNDNSYKILSHSGYGENREFETLEINSNSWRTLDVTLDFKLSVIDCGVSLKGKTYWITDDEFLVSFDYTSERFERLSCLPRQYTVYETRSLSVVREENLAVLIQDRVTKKANKIIETKAVSWRMFLAVNSKLNLERYLWESGRFLVDEEKKVFVFCDTGSKLCIAGENNHVRQVDSGLTGYLFTYVPSLTQF